MFNNLEMRGAFQEEPNKPKPESGTYLPEITKQEIIAWSSQRLRDAYENGATKGITSLEINKKISDLIAVPTNSNSVDDFDNDLEDIDPTYDEAMSIFLDELIGLCAEKSFNQDEEGRLARFGETIAQSLFKDENLLAGTSLGTAIIAAAKATRIPEIQGSIGREITWATSEQFIEADDRGIDEPVKKILSLPLPDFLDAVHQLQTLGAHGAGSQDFEITMQIYSRKILEALSGRQSSPLADYALSLARARLKESPEKINPLSSNNAKLNDKEGARISKPLTPEMSRTSRTLHATIIEGRDTIDSALLPVASDAIGSFDHSLLPRLIGKANLKRLFGPTLPGAEYNPETYSNDYQTGDSFDEEKNRLTRQIRFEPYREIPNNENLNPFSKTGEKNLPLLLQHLHEPALRGKIEQDLGINLVQLPLRSQIHFLRFLSEQDHAGFDRLRTTLTARPELANKILSSFLANAEDLKYAEAILTIAEKVEPTTAEAIFDKYQAIVNTADETERYLAQKLPELSGNERATRDIRNALLHRANELLKEGVTTAPEVMSATLEQIHADIFLFGATCKAADKHGGLSFEAIRGTEVQLVETKNIPLEERKAMLILFGRVREQDKYSDAHMNALQDDLEKKLGAGVGRFYVVKHDGTIVSFVRFEDLPNGNVYAGSFTASPDVRGSTIGSALIQAAFEKENAIKTLEAIVFSGNPRLMEYHTKTLGHVLLKDQTLMIGDALYYRMIRPPQTKTELRQAA